ncbi:hypothetical protein [Anoxybacteroides tepidamans]|uniref:hypothetical protein n=1 Tax=Anoxybacteroides tepidamans TaxID=265948 RepID=UPI0004895904|nr:hypothetical protein [Anoxybacillus tepidamans]
MNKERFQLDFPSDEEIAKHVHFIVQKGMPDKEPFFRKVYTLYRQLGFYTLLPNYTELFFLVILGTALLLAMGLHAREHIEAENIYTFIFVASPLLYLLVCSVSFYRMWDNRTYELEMTCKYDIFQLSSLRMLIFSVFCFAVNTLMIAATVMAYNYISFIKAFLISATGLFLFAVLALFILLGRRLRIVRLLLLTGWVLLNSSAFIWSKHFYLFILNQISISIYLVVVITLIFVYIQQLKNMMQVRTTEGVV